MKEWDSKNRYFRQKKCGDSLPDLSDDRIERTQCHEVVAKGIFSGWVVNFGWLGSTTRVSCESSGPVKAAPRFYAENIVAVPTLWDLDRRFHIMDRFGGLMQVLTLA